MSKQNQDRPGYKHTPLGWIPEEWEIKEFVDITSKILDGTHFSPKSKNGDYKYLTSKNIRNDGLNLTDVDYIEEEEHINIYKRCPVVFGDILLTKDGAGTGACCMNTLTEAFSLLSSVAVLRGKAGVCQNEFLYQYIKSPRGQFTIKDAIAGQAITRITLEKIRRFDIIIPPLSEQHKIATILSTWDEAITTTQQLIYQIEQRNKGLVQQLLTGKKRLKGYHGEWKEKKFEECFKFIKSYSIPRDGLSSGNNENLVYCIHYGDIHALYQNEFLDFVKQEGIPQINNNTLNIDESDYLKEGDIILADASEDYEGVGEAIEVINLISIKAVGGLHTIVIRGIENLTVNYFRAFLYGSETVRNQLRKKATGTSVYSVTKSTLKSLSFKLPDIKEQEAIAKVLINSVTELKLQGELLIKLQQQKKGLMQKLLTGEVRVKIMVDHFPEVRKMVN